MEAKIMKAKRTEKGIIILELDNEDSVKYLAIRGGISWPLMAENLPGYYCILGEEYEEKVRFEKEWRGRLHLIAEHEAPDILTSLGNFFTKLADDTALTLCDLFYTVMEVFGGEDYRGYAEAYNRISDKKKLPARLEQAPYADRPDLGVEFIKEWQQSGKLLLPEDSIARQQLRTLEPSGVKNMATTLNAVNALRFAVCGFQMNKPSKPTSKNWRGADRGSWVSL